MWQKLQLCLKSQISKFTSICVVMGPFILWATYFCMGAYKHDVVVVVKMGAPNLTNSYMEPRSRGIKYLRASKEIL